MSSRSLLWSVGSLAATSLIAPTVAKGSTGSSGSYQLHESWQGEKFLDYFDFFSGADPTNGFVTYANQSYAESSGLIDITSSGSFYMGVDHKTTLSPEGPGRDSVRIESKKYYDEGLYVIDLQHMPGSICGTWPAFWSVGPDWPHDGEIDIIEGVNKHEANEIVLHTSGSCDVGGDHEMLGDMTSSECGDASGTIGCVVKGNQGSSGDPFNKNGGGVYAMEWTADFLKIWYFARGKVPESITNGKPDSSAFGTPMAHLQGTCDFHERFKSQKFILDTTFCGDWAGGVFGDSGCPVKDPSNPIQSCVSYVAENPEAFKEAYWEINSIKLYQIGTSSNTPAETSSSAASQIESATHAVSQAASTSTTQKAAATTKAASSKSETAVAHTASNPPAAEVTSAAAATTKASGSSSGSSGSPGNTGSSEGSESSRSTIYVTETTTVCALTQGTSLATGIPAGQSSVAAENGASSVAPTAPVSQPAPQGTSGVVPSQVPDTPADSQSQDNVPSAATAPGAQASGPSSVAPVEDSHPSNPPSPPQSITVSSSGVVPAPAPAPTSAPPADETPADEEGSAPGGSPGAGSGSGSESGSGSGVSSNSGSSVNSGFSASSVSPIPSATSPISPLFTGAASKLSLSTTGLLGALALAFLA
ncbi:hypothetical protein P170DRAFT_413315 [Aspergillus steynii IBT 23096]|uniref:endo-1,3(4)-beta-glucanase n=1 Tax=Aspergillus steynii IBT 23096 TaxID=1392250 RepID=A0A2I2G3E8_9EURO|nr:uncharacterized protein P170DRAFT_413315 [Aspergillus steynii IBT 23096]PLB47399.1 hypothetical protein P170DRAFT_413315 [Aspergillus steynii IBT 23096]